MNVNVINNCHLGTNINLLSSYYILVNKGIAFLKLERYPEANQVFDKALNIDPEHAGCLYNKGLVLEKLGEAVEATEYKDRAQSIDPTYVGGSINKGPAVSELKSVI